MFASRKFRGKLRQCRADLRIAAEVEWKLDGCLPWPESVGVCYISHGFSFSGDSWRFEISQTDDDTLALFLWRSGDFSQTVAYSLNIKKADGSLYPDRETVWRIAAKKQRGFPSRFVTSELLQRKSEFLPANALTVVCKLKTVFKPEQTNVMYSAFEQCLASEKFCDVTLQVGQQVFKAHKVILSAASPLFADMFENEMTKNLSGTVNIPDCDPGSFKDFLRFLYAGRADVTERNVYHLYRTAHKYCVEELRIHCVAFMLQNLSVDNVRDVAAIGDQYSEIDLKRSCQLIFRKQRLPNEIPL